MPGRAWGFDPLSLRQITGEPSLIGKAPGRDPGRCRFKSGGSPQTWKSGRAVQGARLLNERGLRPTQVRILALPPSHQRDHAGIAQSVERDVAIVEAAVSITAARTTLLRGRWPRAGLIIPPLAVRFRPPRPPPGSSAGRAPRLQRACRRFEAVSGNPHYGCSSAEQSATLRRSRSGVRVTSAVPTVRSFHLHTPWSNWSGARLQLSISRFESGRRVHHAPVAQR